MALATRTRNAADPPAEPMPPEPEAPVEPEAPKSSALEVECPVAEGGCGERWLVDPATGKVTGKPLGAPEGAHSAMYQLLELTGAKSPSLALGVVRAWRADSEVHRKAAIEERAKRENAEKVAALRAAVVAGAITPAMAWQDPEADEPAPKGYWASLSTAALRSELAGYGAPPRVPHVPVPGATGLAGVDMAKWGDKAAQIAQIVNRAQRGGKAG